MGVTDLLGMQKQLDEMHLELQNDFLREAAELLDGAEAALLTLEKTGFDRSHLNHLARVAHNIKGSGKVVGFSELSEFCHVLEDLIVAVRDDSRLLSSTILSLFFESFDAMKHEVHGRLQNRDVTRALQLYVSNKSRISEILLTTLDQNPSIVPQEVREVHLVTIRTRRFVIPSYQVSAIQKFPTPSGWPFPRWQGEQSLTLEGKSVSWMDLTNCLSGKPSSPKAGILIALQIQVGGEKRLLFVDDVIGTEQLKQATESESSTASPLPYTLGTTRLSDGKIAMIVDAQSLAKDLWT